MPTIREILDAGFTVDPEDAQAQDDAVRWARAFYRALGRDQETSLGTALALEPEILQLEVTANVATIDGKALVAVVEVGGARPAVYTLTLTLLGSGLVRLSFVDGNTQLEFDAGDGVTECSVLCLRAPEALRTVLAEELE